MLIQNNCDLVYTNPEYVCLNELLELVNKHKQQQQQLRAPAMAPPSPPRTPPKINRRHVPLPPRPLYENVNEFLADSLSEPIHINCDQITPERIHCPINGNQQKFLLTTAMPQQQHESSLNSTNYYINGSNSTQSSSDSSTATMIIRKSPVHCNGISAQYELHDVNNCSMNRSFLLYTQANLKSTHQTQFDCLTNSLKPNTTSTYTRRSLIETKQCNRISGRRSEPCKLEPLSPIMTSSRADLFNHNHLVNPKITYDDELICLDECDELILTTPSPPEPVLIKTPPMPNFSSSPQFDFRKTYNSLPMNRRQQKEHITNSLPRMTSLPRWSEEPTRNCFNNDNYYVIGPNDNNNQQRDDSSSGSIDVSHLIMPPPSPFRTSFHQIEDECLSNPTSSSSSAAITTTTTNTAMSSSENFTKPILNNSANKMQKKNVAKKVSFKINHENNMNSITSSGSSLTGSLSNEDEDENFTAPHIDLIKEEIFSKIFSNEDYFGKDSTNRLIYSNPLHSSSSSASSSCSSSSSSGYKSNHSQISSNKPPIGPHKSLELNCFIQSNMERLDRLKNKRLQVINGSIRSDPMDDLNEMNKLIENLMQTSTILNKEGTLRPNATSSFISPQLEPMNQSETKQIKTESAKLFQKLANEKHKSSPHTPKTTQLRNKFQLFSNNLKRTIKFQV